MSPLDFDNIFDKPSICRNNSVVSFSSSPDSHLRTRLKTALSVNVNFRHNSILEPISSTPPLVPRKISLSWSSPSRSPSIGGNHNRSSRHFDYFKEMVGCITQSRKECFDNLRLLITRRDAYRKAGDLINCQRIEQQIHRMDIYNLDFHTPELIDSEHSPIMESDTGMTTKDLHLYELFCKFQGVSIIMRDISPAASRELVGTFHLPSEFLDEEGQPIYEVVKNFSFEDCAKFTTHRNSIFPKLINISLKSSIYPPIDGLIPMDPRLSKLSSKFSNVSLKELEHRMKSSTCADGLANRMSIAMAIVMQERNKYELLKRYSKTFHEDIERSETTLSQMMQNYREELMAKPNKREVSEKWIQKFNDAKILGSKPFTTNSGFPVYYFVKGSELVKDNTMDDQLPLFAALYPNDRWHRFNSKTRSYEYEEGFLTKIETGSEPTPLNVLIYRVFVLHSVTNRIVEAPEMSQVVVPDYDGLTYAYDRNYPLNVVSNQNSNEENIEALVEYFENADKRARETKYVEGMGNVSDQDIEHILEVRELTNWRQSHGYEVHNINKCQGLSPGNYTSIRSNGEIRILKNESEIISEIRSLWLGGCPVRLNPKWPVIIDDQGLPLYCPDIVVHDSSLDWAVLEGNCMKPDGITMKSIYEKYCSLSDEQAFPKDIHRLVIEYSRIVDEERLQVLWIQLRQILLEPALILNQSSRNQIPSEQADIIDDLFPQVLIRRQELNEERFYLLANQMNLLRNNYYKRYRQESPIQIPH